ncbi:hypothetical protein [Burkholderia pseudomallei]|uniref:Nmad2 family putative nucleotide modification protein n=1 Tax=Burkholderia pseudomallei TaxID=28450 RepID=UPI001E32F0CA|nr:hypothetical protein [Burkholderia pseudomallei]
MSVTMGYKMTHDSGFAPNPFHGVLTLATCKPKIRACRRPGDWVAGFASQELVDSAARRGLIIPRDGLVYLMQVSEVLPLHAYFEDSRFARKRPPRESSDAVALCGDNIYYHDHRGKYEQLENRHHTRAEAFHDTSGVNALVAGRFYYFGRKCFVPDGGWEATTGGPVSRGRTFYCLDGFAEKVLGYFDAKGIAEGMHALPSLMDEGTPVHPKQFCASSAHESGFAPPVLAGRRSRSGSCGG